MAASRFPLAHGGYSDWKYARTILVDHKKSEEHYQSVLSLAKQSMKVGKADRELTQP